MKTKLTFAVKTSGTEVTIYLFLPTNPQQGAWVKLNRDAEGKWSGEHELNPGSYGYILHIRAGKPNSSWAMSIKRGTNPPLQRRGELDSKGNGVRLGEFTFS